MDINTLRESGLTEGEIKVYLALLEIGLSTSGPITKKARVAKSIVYPLLEKLSEKGLVSHIMKNKTKYFQASDPHKILEFISEKKNKLERNRKEIETMLPELLAKKMSSPKSEATIYYGFKGIRSAHEHLYNKLTAGDEWCYMGVPAHQPKEQHIFWQKDHVRRIKEKIKARMLLNDDTDPSVLKNRNSYKGGDARYMPKRIKTPACFGIFKDTVLIILQSPAALCVEIINQDIADSFQAYFEEFWRKSMPFKG